MTDLNKLMQKCDSVSEAYARNNGINRTPDWFLFKLQEELGELTKAYVNAKGLGRKTERTQEELKQNLAEEFADVLGHLLLFAKHHEIDPDTAIQNKWLKYLSAEAR